MCYFDVFEYLPFDRGRFDFALVLVQQRYGANERQVLLVVASKSCLTIEEAELFGEWIDHAQRP